MLNKLLPYTAKGIFTAVWVSPPVQSTSPVH